MVQSARCWYRDGGDALIRREIDGLTLLYHRPSGITHIADSPVPEILDALTRDPQPLEAIITRLAHVFDLPDGSDTRGLEQHLEGLVALGLVRVTV